MSIDTLQGRVIDGRYELLERIGAGSMGSVYRARQRVVDRLVAVKLLHVEADADVWRTRFEREAKALGKFDHPGCVRVYDFGWFADIDTPFLVSEFIEGVPLYERLGHRLSPRERVGYVRDIAEAMAHAHGHGVIHRDLKPENVLITHEGRVKVVDFGLARTTQDAEIRLTQVGDAHGTPAYMSPEQCRGDDVLTPACDVYALGCVLFELFERKLPYTSATASGVMIKHVTDPIPKQSNAATPAAVRQLIIAMMQKAPTSRPTMAEVAIILCDVFASLPPDDEQSPPPPRREPVAVVAPPVATTEDDPLRVTTWLVGDDEVESDLVEGRRRVVPAVIAVVCVALLTVFVVVSIGGEDSADPSALSSEAEPGGPEDFAGAEPRGSEDFAGAEPRGPEDLAGAEPRGPEDLAGAEPRGPEDLAGAEPHGPEDLAGAEPRGPEDFSETKPRAPDVAGPENFDKPKSAPEKTRRSVKLRY